MPRSLAALTVSAMILLAGPLDDLIRQPVEDGDHVVGQEMR